MGGGGLVDIRSIVYDVDLITEHGYTYGLNGSLEDLTWDEPESELSARASITVANRPIGSSWLSSILKLNCIVRIYARFRGMSKTLVFEGTVWDWQYTSATEQSIVLISYDALIRLQQSRDFKYFSAGMTTQALIENICADWGISVRYRWEHSITHEKKVFNAVRISDMITDLLEEVRRKKKSKYVARLGLDGQLLITGYGMNETVYRFDRDNTVSTTNKLSMGRLVTRVKVIGKQDDDGRAPIEAIVDGDLRFGVLQEIIRRDGDATLEDVMAEADAVIDERGTPEETVLTDVPDVPVVRKGDLVEMAAGNLLGFFYVEAVTHKEKTRRMVMTLSRAR